MKRSSLGLCVLLLALVASAPAHASFGVVQWSWGDCRIWYEAGNPPWGGGWRVLVGGLPTYEAAARTLDDMYRGGVCR